MTWRKYLAVHQNQQFNFFNYQEANKTMTTEFKTICAPNSGASKTGDAGLIFKASPDGHRATLHHNHRNNTPLSPSSFPPLSRSSTPRALDLCISGTAHSPIETVSDIVCQVCGEVLGPVYDHYRLEDRPYRVDLRQWKAIKCHILSPDLIRALNSHFYQDDAEQRIRQYSTRFLRIAGQADLTEIAIKQALTIFQKAIQKPLRTLGMCNVEFLARTCLIYVLRQHHDSMGDQRIQETGRSPTLKELLLFINHMKLPNIAPRLPQDYIFTLGAKLGINSQLQTDAFTLACRYKMPPGYNPKGVAAAAIYVICKHQTKISQHSICQAADICEVTLRNNARELYTTLGGVKNDHP
jgi:transcription initiation factor TFIIIB Brf1 subunit/transcription initiation factor TFIIB